MQSWRDTESDFSQRMSAILLDGKIVHYEVLGRGRPIIFVHGWVGSWRYWVPAMQIAAKSFRAYAIDLWGFGETAHDPSSYSIARQTTLLASFIQKMGIGKVTLIGHGLGALTALLFTQKFPDGVDRLMVANIPLEINFVAMRLRIPASPTSLAAWLLRKEPAMEPARIDATKTDPLAITSSLKSLEIMNFMPFMDTMPIPCLIVHGQDDPAVKTPDHKRVLAMTDQVDQIVLDHCGHFPMLDEGLRFNNLMMNFLALVSGASPRDMRL